jgi:hypothetical protein
MRETPASRFGMHIKLTRPNNGTNDLKQIGKERFLEALEYVSSNCDDDKNNAGDQIAHRYEVSIICEYPKTVCSAIKLPVGSSVGVAVSDSDSSGEEDGDKSRIDCSTFSLFYLEMSHGVANLLCPVGVVFVKHATTGR